jgi:hypothetical protein
MFGRQTAQAREDSPTGFGCLSDLMIASLEPPSARIRRGRHEQGRIGGDQSISSLDAALGRLFNERAGCPVAGEMS